MLEFPLRRRDADHSDPPTLASVAAMEVPVATECDEVQVAEAVDALETLRLRSGQAGHPQRRTLR